jgi:hypothetical protein
MPSTIDDRLSELLHLDRPERSATILRVGECELLFINRRLYAYDFEGMVYVRDDLPLLPFQRRVLNRWRRFDSQIPLDRFSFVTILGDAVGSSLREVQKTISKEEI